MALRAYCETPNQCPHAIIPQTPRARLIKVQDEVSKLFTDVHESGRNGRNVHEALVALRWVLKVVDHAILRVGRI